ncbi:hypothetical protein SI65_10045 [Aspergillus cristatus]|uniref:RING-CH-type domain-containing protein n=1 Tax=Aspergillus cristatus TaxID=573508 RepID=A0A1E3B0W7_ASPCR|nr:hypothetical protein SI65_10045 [Aspergillus cristatus]
MDLRSEPRWQWPSSSSAPSSSEAPRTSDPPPNRTETSDTASPESSKKHYGPRECRICLETVYPTFHPPSENLPGFLQPKPRVVYESSDPESGRLLRPCRCKGSSRYVHEGCLQSWRHADPGYAKRNYWQCPTCGFQYRLERLRWSRWISSAMTQITLTLGILVLTVFLLGFVADPIINLYVDPVDTIYHVEYWESSLGRDVRRDVPSYSWIEHFAKGFTSLGVLSLIKTLLGSLSWQIWVRSSTLNGRNSSRNRAASISWIMIALGVLTFLAAVYKGVRSWSRRTLEKAGERVLDVPLPDDDDEDEQAPSSGDTQGPSKKDD